MARISGSGGRQRPRRQGRKPALNRRGCSQGSEPGGRKVPSPGEVQVRPESSTPFEPSTRPPPARSRSASRRCHGVGTSPERERVAWPHYIKRPISPRWMQHRRRLPLAKNLKECPRKLMEPPPRVRSENTAPPRPAMKPAGDQPDRHPSKDDIRVGSSPVVPSQGPSVDPRPPPPPNTSIRPESMNLQPEPGDL